jgi:hypothetical protein
MITAKIIIQAPKIFDRLIVSPRIRIAKAAATITSRVEIIAAFAGSIRLSPAKRHTIPKTVENRAHRIIAVQPDNADGNSKP